MKHPIFVLKIGLIIANLVAFESSAQEIREKLSSATYICCIDGGGSKTEMQVMDNQGRLVPIFKHDVPVESVKVPGSNMCTIGEKGVQQRLQSLFNGMKVGDKKLPIDDVKKDMIIFAGLAGGGASMNNLAIRKILHDIGFLPDNLFVYSDGGLMFQAFKPGEILLICGTGSACVGKDVDGKRIVRGGFGRLLGDEGSGYHIGLQAIKKALEIDQEEGEQTSLIPLIKEHLSVMELKNAVTPLQQGTITPDQVASLAPSIFLEAKRGDECAKQLVHAAAQDLGILLSKMVQRVGCEKQTIYLTGGIFKGNERDAFIQAIFRSEAFKETYEQARPEVKLLTDRNPAVIAALKLLESDKGSI